MTAKLWKILAAAVAGVVALAVVGMLIVAWTFDPNDYKGYVADWVERETGRQFGIDDDLTLSYFPWLAVETGGIRLGNAPGFGPEPFVRIDRAAVRVRLLPLVMRREIELGLVALEGIELNLARDAELRGNWEDLLGSDEDVPQDDTGGVGSSLETLDVAGLRVRDGMIVWREMTSETRYVVDTRLVQTGRIAVDEPVEVQLELGLLDVAAQDNLDLSVVGIAELSRDGTVAIDGLGVQFLFTRAAGAGRAEGRLSASTFRYTADGGLRAGETTLTGELTDLVPARSPLHVDAGWREASFEPGSQTLSVDGLRTDVGGVGATWQLSGQAPLDDARLSGSVTVASTPLDRVSDLLGVSPPDGVDPRALGSIQLATDFQFTRSPRALTLSSFQADLLGMRPNGEVSLDAEDRFRGRITVPEFVPNAGFLALIRPSLPDEFDEGTIGRISLSASIAGDLGGERITLEDVRASTLGASATGELTIEGGERLRGRIDIPEFAPGNGLLALVGPHLPSGLDTGALDRVALSARFDTDLETQRTSLRDLRAGLLGATLSGEIDVIPEQGGNVYRGAVQAPRFPSSRFAVAFASFLPEEVDPAELGVIALDTRFAYDERTDILTLDPLALELFGLAGTGQLTGRALSSSAEWSGQASIQRFSPRDLFRRFGQPVPDTSDATVLTRATIDTAFEIDERRGRFQSIVLELDDSRITGDFTVDGFDDPGYQFSLVIDRVDADRYLPPRADEGGPGEATAGDVELPAEALNTLQVDGRVQVGELALAGMRFEEVGTQITVGGGSGRLDSARARLYGGTFEGSFNVDAQTATPGLTLNGRAENLQLRPLIEALMGEANFSGTGSFDLALSGRGPTVLENVRSANGNVAFTLTDGAIEGFNLGRTLCSVYNTTQRLPGPAQQPDVTRFQLIRGTARVEGGVAHSSDLLARAAFMAVSGGGQLTLAEQRMDYDLAAELTDSIGIQGCESMDPLIGDSIPFRIRGTVAEPQISPDFSKIVEQRIRDEVRDRATERLQERLQDLIRSR